MALNKSKYPKKVRIKAFKYYKQLDGSATQVSKKLREELGHTHAPSVVTVLKWAEKYDWDGKVEAAKELVRETLMNFDDPVVKRIVKDDVFLAEIVALMTGVVVEAVKKKRSKFIPRNSGELINMLKFLIEQRTKVLGQGGVGVPARSAEQLTKTSLKSALYEVLGETPQGKEAAHSIVVDLRKRMRLVKNASKADGEVAS